MDAAIRAALLDRFGMFGVRSPGAVAIRVGDAATLADDLLERSGLVALRNEIDQHFAQRADMPVAHRAGRARRFVGVYPTPATPRIVADIEPPLADTHAFEELRLLSFLRCAQRPSTMTRWRRCVADHRRLGHRRGSQAGAYRPG